jgi:ABC-type multidrug transport system fused ATPase/permease subunit
MLNQYNSKSEVGNKHFRNIYILIAVCIFVFTWVRDYFLNLCLYCSNKKLYKDAIHALVYASLKSFKNKNSGDSLDKFSQDLVVLDNNLSNIVNLELVMVFQCLSQIVQLSIVDPFLIIFGVLIVVVSYVCYEYCAPVIVAQRKLSLTLKGAPILDSFSEMIRNIKAVKIYKLQSLMKWETEKAMVNSGRAYMSYHKTLMAFQFYTQFLLLMVEIGLMFWMIRQTMGKNIGIFCSSMISLFGIYEYCDWILCNSIFISTLLASMERMDRFTQ